MDDETCRSKATVFSSTARNSLAQFEHVILLDTLRPEITRVRARQRGFGSGIGMAIGAMTLKQGADVSIFSYWGGLVTVAVISGLLLTLATSRRVTWAVFHSKAGGVSFAVAR